MPIDRTEIEKYFKKGNTIPRCVDRSVNFKIIKINAANLQVSGLWSGEENLDYKTLSSVIDGIDGFETLTTIPSVIEFVNKNTGNKLKKGHRALYATAKEYLNRSGKASIPVPTQQTATNVRRTLEDVQREFEQDVEEAKKRSSAERKTRLEKAPKTPKSSTVTTKVFKRNADVVAAVLERAKSECERKGNGCKNPVPFQRNDGSTFLEVHHIIRLADGGDDTVENAIALCPNCHKELHFGKIN